MRKVSLREYINENEYEFVGFWDRCFFSENTKERGYIFEDKNGKNIHKSFYEIKKECDKIRGK